MNNNRLLKSLKFALFALLLSIPLKTAGATSLSLGADYSLRGVSIIDRDKTQLDNDYYDSKLQAYLITDLSKDVEAQVRVQSITPWGLEGSTAPLATRYPDANGGLWVQNAFIRLPNVWRNNVVLTIGRQPIVWGDGAILSDDDLGFNAIRAQVKSPIRFLPFDLDAFTAKVDEGLQLPGDTDLQGINVAFNYKYWRWEMMGLWEKSDVAQGYEMGADTFTITASNISRKILGVRTKANLKDAYLKGEYYFQDGSVSRMMAKDITLDGQAFVLGMGGKSNTSKWGRFGAVLEMAVGDGDDTNTPEQDESFRPTFASRWSGLERSGYGNYFAATFSDVYYSTAPFAPVTSVNDGLPPGTSGIQTIHFGVDATPWSKWTFTFDYYQYKAQKNVSGPKELGVEFDYGVEYRYSGLVTFRATTSQFEPGDAFDAATQQDGVYSSAEAEIRF